MRKDKNGKGRRNGPIGHLFRRLATCPKAALTNKDGCPFNANLSNWVFVLWDISPPPPLLFNLALARKRLKLPL